MSTDWSEVYEAALAQVQNRIPGVASVTSPDGSIITFSKASELESYLALLKQLKEEQSGGEFTRVYAGQGGDASI